MSKEPFEKKYYIDTETHYSMGERYWFMIEDRKGLYTKYYYDERDGLVEVEKYLGRKRTYLRGSDYVKALERSKEVTRVEWDEYIFFKGL